MTRSLHLILPALAALLLLAWLLRPRETTELPWSIRLFEPEPPRSGIRRTGKL